MVRKGGREGEEECQVEGIKQHVESLAGKVHKAREMLDTQTERTTELESRVSHPETFRDPGAGHRSVGERGAPTAENSPTRGYGLPTPGVVTLKPRPEEPEALLPVASLVAEWHRLRTGGDAGSSRVEPARAEERRWELGTEMVRGFGLTLPLDTELLNKSRRDTHLGWRKEALVRARRERIRAGRLRLLRRLFTIGLWWK